MRLLEDLAAQGHDGSPSERLRAGIRAVLQYAERESAAWRVLFVGEFDEPAANAARRRVLDAGSAAIAQRLAVELTERGIEYPDSLAEMLAAMSRAAVDALIAWWYDHPTIALDEVVEVAHRFLWAALEAQAGVA